MGKLGNASSGRNAIFALPIMVHGSIGRRFRDRLFAYIEAWITKLG